MSKDSLQKQLPEGEIIPTIYDFMFTTIYNNVENIILCENFLSMYFGISIEEIKGKVKILSRNLKQESKFTARKQVDLLLERGKEKINIEVSTSMSTGIVERNLILLSNIHTTHYKKGDKNYSHIGSSIQINFINDASYIVGKDFQETFYLRNAKGDILTEKFRIDYINIAKLESTCYTSSTKELEDFCRLLITSEEKVFKEMLGGIRMEKEAKERLEEEVMKYSQDEEIVAIYSDYTKDELERNTIIHDRVEEQKKKLLEEVRNKMLEEQKIIIHDRVEKQKKKLLEEQRKKMLEEQKIIIHDRVEKQKKKLLEEQRKKMLEEQKIIIDHQVKEEKKKIVQVTLIEIARNLLRANIDFSTIVESTGLTKEEIESLQ